MNNIDDCDEGKPCMSDEQIALVEKKIKFFEEGYDQNDQPRISEEKNGQGNFTYT